LDAEEVLALSPEVLECAILDEAGRILSYAGSDRGSETKPAADFRVTVKALVIQGLSEALPRNFGNLKYTVVVTDRFRIFTMPLDGRTVMFTATLRANPDMICEAALKRFGTKGARRIGPLT
jgi:hypothetical protein